MVSPSPRSSPHALIALMIVSLLPFWAAYRHQSFLNDDTYITLTYAKNLAQGNGFVYNHPPAVLGTTTPLLTIIVASLMRLLPFAEAATLAVFFSAAC